MTKKTRHLLQDAFSLYFSQILAFALQLFLGIYIPKLLGIFNYGLYASSFLFLNALSFVVESVVVYPFMVRNSSKRSNNLLKTYVSFGVIVVVLLILGVFLLKDLFSIIIFKEPSISEFLIFAGIAIPFIFLQRMYLSLLQSQEKIKKVALLEISSSLIGSFFVLLLILNSVKDPMLYFFASISRLILITPLSIYHLASKFSFDIFSVISSVKKESVYIENLTYKSLSSFFKSNFSGFVLAFLFSTNEVGIYSIVQKVANPIIWMFKSVNRSVISFVLGKSYKKTTHVIERIWSYQVFFNLLYLSYIIVFFDKMYLRFFGSEFGDLYLFSLVWILPITLYNTIYLYVYPILKDNRVELFKFNTLLYMIAFILFVIIASPFGFLAVIISFGLSELIKNIHLMLSGLKLKNYKIRLLPQSIIASILIGILFFPFLSYEMRLYELLILSIIYFVGGGIVFLLILPISEKQVIKNFIKEKLNGVL